jgi:hypothetical protein
MPTKIRQQTWDVLEAVTGICEPQKELVVHRVVVAGIDPIAVVKNAATKERRSRWDVEHVMIGQHKAAELDLPSHLYNVAVLVNPGDIPVQYVNGAIVLEGRSYRRKTSGPVDVIGIEPPNNFSGSHPEAFVERLTLTSVRLRDPT